MNLSIGIVGLPNVGKSTLFNALLKKQVAFAANYPFATIEPNVGVVEVPDERLPVLAKVVNTQKIVPAIVEFYDIAGLVKGASQGEGLGNKFLSHIREVAAIAHVVRLFEDGDIIHVANKVDPLDDMKIVETELILADLETVSKPSVAKAMEGKAKDLYDNETIEQLKTSLNRGIPARDIKFTDEQKKTIKPLNLLTFKPVLYVFNVSEEQLEQQESTVEKINQILKQAESTEQSERIQDDKGKDSGQARMTNQFIFLNAKLENEVLTLDEKEQKEYLKQFNLEDTGLNRLIKKSYELLGLISFLTAGEKEVRAWTITKGTLAPQAAAVIHTDFEKHFIKADVIPYPNFVSANGWVKGREIGKVTSAGKDYKMRDGDVVEFKVNV